jgi:hypothetical protein
VTAALARLCQCAGYRVDTGRENYICHIGSALFILAPYEFVKVRDKV